MTCGPLSTPRASNAFRARFSHHVRAVLWRASWPNRASPTGLKTRLARSRVLRATQSNVVFAFRCVFASGTPRGPSCNSRTPAPTMSSITASYTPRNITNACPLNIIAQPPIHHTPLPACPQHTSLLLHPPRPGTHATHRIISLPPKITNKYVPTAITTAFCVLNGLSPETHVRTSTGRAGRCKAVHMPVMVE